MPGSNADDIMGDYFEGEDWDALIELEPDLEPPPLPAPPSTD
jgi:hypothetical protein